MLSKRDEKVMRIYLCFISERSPISSLFRSICEREINHHFKMKSVLYPQYPSKWNLFYFLLVLSRCRNFDLIFCNDDLLLTFRVAQTHILSCQKLKVPRSPGVFPLLLIQMFRKYSKIPQKLTFRGPPKPMFVYLVNHLVRENRS